MRNQDAPENNLGPEPLLVWDLPTRLFHWLLVVLVVVSYVTGKTGGLAMQYHMWSGYSILTLLIFRFAWGFIGGRHARFSSFVRGPAAVWRYLRTFLRAGHTPQPGHNPLGGWSVLAMLFCLMLQAGTGMFADDQIFTRGPLNPWVSYETASWLTLIHLLNQRLLLFLIIIHMGAVLFHLLVKRDNLITPMITGYKRFSGAIETPAEKSSTAAAIITAILSAAAVFFLVR